MLYTCAAFIDKPMLIKFKSYAVQRLLWNLEVCDMIAGVVTFTTKCRLVSSAGTINGTLSVTKNELYFEMDDDDEENKKMPQSVSLTSTCQSPTLSPAL